MTNREPGTRSEKPVNRIALIALAAVTLCLIAASVDAGAPRDGDQFVNLVGHRDRPGPLVMWPFLLRKAWTSLVGRGSSAPFVAYDPDALKENPSITWIGHATMLVRMDGVTLLTDPMFSERASPIAFLGPKRLVPPGVPLDTLPPIDFVTLSHSHYDHTDLPSIAALAKRGTRFIVPLRMGELVRDEGGEAVELDWWDSIDIGPVRVYCVPVQHFSGRTLTDTNERLWAGWVVVGPTRRFFHAGDTGYFEGFKEIGERLGPIDLAALPIGAYEPEAIMRFVHENPAEALQTALDVRAARVVGMHYGTFDLTDEPPDEPPRVLRAEADKRGLSADQVWTMSIGETRRW